MILPCTPPPDAIHTNMKSAGSGRGLTTKLNGRANFGPVTQNAGQYGQARSVSKKERPAWPTKKISAIERRSDSDVSYNEGNWQGKHGALCWVGSWWWTWFARSQIQSKGSEKSASTASRVFQPELSVLGTVYRLQLWRLRPSTFSRRDWIGVKMWIFKASASHPLHLQVTSYKLQAITAMTCLCTIIKINERRVICCFFLKYAVILLIF